MKIIPKTKKDLNWINWGAKDLKKESEKIIDHLRVDYEKIKSIPKKERTFENSVYAFEVAGDVGYSNPISFLKYVSPSKATREAANKSSIWLQERAMEIGDDIEAYHAFMEYSPRSEKLSDEEKRFYKEKKLSFKRRGFHLSEEKRKDLLTIKKKLMKLEDSFTKNIADYEDQILCTKEQLNGLPESYISNLKKDKKTGKYIVSLAYPEVNPFLSFAEDSKKRLEIAKKRGKKGGMKNIKLLKEMLSLRKEKANLLGYDTFADFVTKDRISKGSKNVMKFLNEMLEKMKPSVKSDFKEIQKFAKKELGIKEIDFSNAGYVGVKYRKHLFDYDPNEIKEYFPMEKVMEYMFDLFGGLFGVSFKKSKINFWHKDVLGFDVIENKKTIGHIVFDLFPRKGKYGHMACWNLLSGKPESFRSKNYKAPFSVIVGNFPKKTKKNPSLLSIREIETMFHEFGHMSHDFLTRATIPSFAGTGTDSEFVETPSQMFENWIQDRDILKEMSCHYKTGKKIPSELLDKIDSVNNFMKSSANYGSFTLALHDMLMHSTHYKKDPREVGHMVNRKYSMTKMDPDSLFPASLGHISGGYEAGMYTYMWSLSYSYDIFSRFKKEGIKSKKAGKDLRDKILSKGGSVDEMSQMKAFLGRKPNNKAFLEALGIK